jgi:hypothetical protein
MGETAGAGVAEGKGVTVGVAWNKGIGMDSLQEAASMDRASAVGNRRLATLARTRFRELRTCIPLYMGGL